MYVRGKIKHFTCVCFLFSCYSQNIPIDHPQRLMLYTIITNKYVMFIEITWQLMIDSAWLKNNMFSRTQSMPITKNSEEFLFIWRHHCVSVWFLRRVWLDRISAANEKNTASDLKAINKTRLLCWKCVFIPNSLFSLYFRFENVIIDFTINRN